MTESADAGVRWIADGVATGRLSARDVVAAALHEIDAVSYLGAFWQIDAERALADAAAIDETVRAGSDPGPLGGVPVAVKNAISIRGLACGGGAPAGPAQRDAAIVRRLRRLGAVIVGSAAMHQLGMGMSGQAPGRPHCRNPLDTDRQPGGSSSGSAVAVAAGLVPLAIGTDSAGSVRQPAAWCGVVGLKPPRRAISRAGIVPLAPLLDTVGLLAATTEDARIAFGAVTGTTTATIAVRGLRAGVDQRAFENATGDVQAACQAVLQALERRGVALVPCAPPVRGVRLGPIFDREIALRFPEPQRWMGDEVRAAIARGTELDEAAHATAVRALIAARRSRISLDIDAVVGPTCLVEPPPLRDPDDVATVGRLTRPFNMLDWPAISVPTARPTVGLQVAVPRGQEPIMWALAAAADQLRGA